MTSIKTLTAAERSTLAAVAAKITAAKSVDDLGDCDRLAAIIQTISDHAEDELFARLSNAEHGVSDIDMGDDFEENAAYAVACIERVLKWKPAREAA